MNLNAAQEQTTAAPGGTGPGGDLIAEVYEHFPHAIMVVDAARQIVTANRRARLMLNREGEEGFGTCCGLFGCRRPGGPLERGCITELTLQAAERQPELRLDVPAAPSGALWVTAGPLDGGAVVFEMRAGSPHDRRARRRTYWSDGPQLRIFALGSLRVESRGEPLTGEWMTQQPGQLLSLLVAERDRVVPNEAIASALWGDTSRAATSRVGELVDNLREQIEPARRGPEESSLVVTRRAGYTLNAERVWIDVDGFDQEVRGAKVAFADGDHAEAIRRFERAAALYRDDFLVGEPEATWALAERERLRHPAAETLRYLAMLHEDEPFKSASYLERLGRMEPFDSEIHQALIATLLCLGRRNRATRHYKAFRRRLRNTFGDDPDFEFTELGAP
jgi:DNA-binding SARP family transcriptional activator